MAIVKRTTKTVTENFSSAEESASLGTQSTASGSPSLLDVKSKAARIDFQDSEQSQNERPNSPSVDSGSALLSPETFSKSLSMWLVAHVGKVLVASLSIVGALFATVYFGGAKIGRIDTSIETLKTDVSELKTEFKEVNRSLQRVETQLAQPSGEKSTLLPDRTKEIKIKSNQQ